MTNLKWVTAATIATSLVTGSASAEEVYGVNVYPGARQDATQTQMTRSMQRNDASCYLTGDSIEKVADFYDKQPGLKSSGRLIKTLIIYEKNGIKVILERPWLDPAKGIEQKDSTRITIKHD